MAVTGPELPRVGSTFAGQFALLEIVGEGGMGVVFRALQLNLQREVALKVLRPTALAGGYEQFRLEREAVSAARFRSQYVIDIYDWGVSVEGLPYLVMELLHGETMAALLEREPTVEPALVAAWLRQCAEALDEAASLGIVHRDIKPANLFLAEDSITGTTAIKILDFGITKVFDRSRGTFRHEVTTQSSLRLGTTGYMSPEQLRATNTVDARADVWSLGVVVYQALAGRRPFERSSEADLIVSILSDEPARLSSVNPWLSPAVADAVGGALEKSADARYPSAGAFSRALTAALTLGTPALPASAPAGPANVVQPAPSFAIGARKTSDAGSETKASNDSMRAVRTPPRSRALKVLAIAGTTFTVSSALALATGALPFTKSAPAAPSAMKENIPRNVGDGGNQGRTVQLSSTSDAQKGASGSPAAEVQLPLPKRSADTEHFKARRVQSVIIDSSSPPSKAPASPAPSAQQFERANPYAN